MTMMTVSWTTCLPLSENFAGFSVGLTHVGLHVCDPEHQSCKLFTCIKAPHPPHTHTHTHLARRCKFQMVVTFMKVIGHQRPNVLNYLLYLPYLVRRTASSSWEWWWPLTSRRFEVKCRQRSNIINYICSITINLVRKKESYMLFCVALFGLDAVYFTL